MNTITATGIRGGHPYTVSDSVDDAEVARRKALSDAKRIERNPAMIEGMVLLARLTDAEWMAIQATARANAQISRWVTIATATNQINLASVETLAAKAGLLESGILTRERVDIVFASPS